VEAVLVTIAQLEPDTYTPDKREFIELRERSGEHLGSFLRESSYINPKSGTLTALSVCASRITQ
jgi:hypothetical protein